MLSRLCSEPTPFDESFQAPSSTSRRMAPGRAGLSLSLAAQASTLSRSSDERRMVATASCPVVRRLFFVPAAICFLFFSPSSSTDPAAVFNPREGGGGDPGTSRPYGLFVPDVPALDGSESV